MLCARWGNARDTARAFTYLLFIVCLQLTLLRLYGIVADQDEEDGSARSAFGETDESLLYERAYAMAMNATGLTSNDLDGTENATLLRANLLEYRSFLKDDAAIKWLSGAHTHVDIICASVVCPRCVSVPDQECSCSSGQRYV